MKTTNATRPQKKREGATTGSLTLKTPSRTIANVGSLAQLAEQRTLNPSVAGSSPARPTVLYTMSRVVSSGVEHLTFNQGVAGSNPARPTPN